MRWWFYALLLAMPLVIGENNVRAGGEFLPVFAAAVVFAIMALGSMEAAILIRRALRRPQPGASLLEGLRHRTA
ncbi:MAG TPA: hypothetical protein VME41_17550 [Stellaceae bacterium]|nr:hypothetical protein [Stellaceae bacterium]